MNDVDISERRSPIIRKRGEVANFLSKKRPLSAKIRSGTTTENPKSYAKDISSPFERNLLSDKSFFVSCSVMSNEEKYNSRSTKKLLIRRKLVLKYF